jgi:outer membrane protein OmpA-like peptidoglycan-associated protein
MQSLELLNHKPDKMKKSYSLIRVFILSALMVFPLAFYAQNSSAGQAKKQKTEKKSRKPKEAFSPYLFWQAQFGPSWSHAEVATTLFVPDLAKNHQSFVGAGSLGFGYQFLSWLNVYGGLNRGYAKGYLSSGNAKSKYMPNSSHNYWFTSDYYGADLNLGFNLSNLFAGNRSRLVDFGIHAGLGQMQWKSKTYDKTTGSLVVRHGYKGNTEPNNGGISDRKVSLTVPVGGDINFNINDKWTIYGDYTYNWMDTDLLDGVVSGYGNGGRDGVVTAMAGVRYNIRPNGVGSMVKKADQAAITATPDVLAEKGDSVEVTVKGTFPPKYFSKNAAMIIQPVIKYEGGEKTLAPIKLKGEKVAGEGELISYKNGGSFKHTYKVPYEKGMNVSQVVTRSVVYPYNGKEYASVKDAVTGDKKARTMPEKKIADGTIVTARAIQHNEHFYFAPDGYQKETIVTNKSALYFKVNLAKLDWHLPLNKNKANYNALKNNLSDLYKGWKVKNIDIEGWASPEGEETFNQGLSERRAQTMEKYIKSKIKRELHKKDNHFAFSSVKDLTFKINANGPDWNGFMKAVENSNITDKSAILNVINSADESKKEAEIRNMIQIYPELERDILPPLRRAELYVNTLEPKRPESEIAQLATSPNYGELKIAEILHAANLTNDLNTKKQIYANAMKRYPNCWRAVANAGAVEVELGNYDEAKALLTKAMKMNKNAAVIRNSMGILYTRMGDFKKAEHCFLFAQKLGADENYNLGVVNILKGDYAKAVQLLSNSKCDYNLGLAQMLNGNLNDAASTLKCAKESARTDYLQAVIGARKGDKTMVYNYLTKAIKQDAAYKSKAAKDREFLKFFKEPDFKALTGTK